MDPETFLPRSKVHAFLLHDSMVVANIIQNRYVQPWGCNQMAGSAGLKSNFSVGWPTAPWILGYPGQNKVLSKCPKTVVKAVALETLKTDHKVLCLSLESRQQLKQNGIFVMGGCYTCETVWITFKFSSSELKIY